MDHEHLSVYAVSCPDPDQRNPEFAGNLRTQRRRNFFEYDAETARLLEQVRIAEQLLRFGFLFGAHGVSAVFVD